MAEKDDFFVGYMGRLPKTHRVFIPALCLLVLVGFALGSLAIAGGQADPGDGRINFGARLQETGVLYAEPFPHLRTPPSADSAHGRTYLIVRAGKRGVFDLARRNDGRLVEFRGVWTERGSIRMIQMGGRPPFRSLKDADMEPGFIASLTPVEKLGRWRISGEICDGKCYLGAMRPGRGLAHKACANLCIIGGAPAVFVTEEPVIADLPGSEFLLIAGPDGLTPPAQLYDYTAVLLQAEGEIERRGDLLVFKLDFDSIEKL